MTTTNNQAAQNRRSESVGPRAKGKREEQCIPEEEGHA
jgi:hypothetical protein